MTKMIRTAVACLPALLLAAGAVLIQAQQPSAPSKPDSPQVKALVDSARKTAGDEWAEAFTFWCAANQTRANRPDDPVIDPVRIFDNLYATGRTTTLVFAIKTTAGIILIDAGYQDDVEKVLLPGMKTLGLDPVDIKHVIITHAHADHFGGAKYLQDHFNSHVWLSAADWDVMLRPPAPGRGGPAVMPPKRDMTIAEGQPLTLGDETVTPVYLPGHTPGTIALIFGVKDRGKPHVAGLLGAPMLVPPPDAAVRQHIESLAHFGGIAKTMKVDVELLNHPMMDGTPAKIARLQTRTERSPNPFVVGVNSYQRFLSVSSDCLKGVLVRRAEAAATKS
jgi:metallo-beta-lactamase class B